MSPPLLRTGDEYYYHFFDATKTIVGQENKPPHALVEELKLGLLWLGTVHMHPNGRIV